MYAVLWWGVLHDEEEPVSERTTFTVAPLEAGEHEPLRAILGRSLHFPPAAMGYWFDGIGAANFRVVRAGGRVVGGLGILRMGQWYGGSAVPLAGIGAVGIAPEWRGHGAASALLRATLAELRAEGMPLAGLYPSTLPVYRKAGFERAAQITTYDIPLTILDPRAPLAIVPAAPDDDALCALYTQAASLRNGALDRSPFLWHKILFPFGQEAHAYRFVRAGATEGYVIYAQEGRADPLLVLDWACLTRDAGQTLLAFLAAHRAMIATARLRGGPQEPLLHLLPEPHATIARRLELLLRVLDVPGALAARGYPPHPRADLHLAVEDDLLPENTGRFVLRVADGRGTVEHGGAGTFRLTIRALASLYSGFLTPHDLVMLGELAAPAADLALAAAIFGGPAPWLVDMF
jgi:predicted acetyltransferase